ncbi:MAG: serine/threonine-protein kinase [Limisphaerales bacterium]
MNTIRICPVCGKALPPDAPAGLCPVCLFKADAGANPPGKGSSGEPTSTLTIGPEVFARVRYFGDYELQEEIARGGMGVVWKSRQVSLNRTVAVKMILAGKLAGEDEVLRFRREAEAAANLQHPNIVAIHEVGEQDGQHYYSMDYIEGRDLGTLVRESGLLPPARAAECLQTIAEAVHFAHQRGTLHRDLKPQNILVDAAGVPRITDFGLAKFVERDESLTQSGATMGSPSYMPPEQAAGHLDQVGPHSDVYSLGAILYELLTSRPPFRAETAVATMRLVMESDPVPPRKLNPDVPPDLETICAKCLEKNPAHRYPSARALAEELGRFLKHEPIQAVPVSAIRKTESWLRRHPWTLVAVASLVILVLAGLLDWQHERVKSLENRPLSMAPALHNADSHGENLDAWSNFMFFLGTPVCLFWTLLILDHYGRGKKSVKQLFVDRQTAWAPLTPVSQSMRIVCGLVGFAGVAVAVAYFAKFIHQSVWDRAPRFFDWAGVYANFYFSLLLLSRVMRDYQKFIHGTPGRGALSAGQIESMRQAIFDGEPITAMRLYRRTMRGASLVEAKDHVEKLTAELLAKHPDKFAPPRPLGFNWSLAGIYLLVELAIAAAFWTFVPPKEPGASLSALAFGFLSGAGVLLSLRLPTKWMKFSGMFLCFLLPLIMKPGFFRVGNIYFGSFVMGVFMILSGFTPKRRKPAKILLR